jgi:hypothetical protein
MSIGSPSHCDGAALLVDADETGLVQVHVLLDFHHNSLTSTVLLPLENRHPGSLPERATLVSSE